jgi:YD repeat-containing protein
VLNYANSFDFVHRLTSQALSNPAFQWSPPGGTTAYAPDRLNRYASVGGVTQAYDANSNLTGDGTWTYVYDAENRLLSAEQADRSFVGIGHGVELGVHAAFRAPDQPPEAPFSTARLEAVRCAFR